MVPTPGTKLGHYEVLAPIGAGGMGEVYRARDSRLSRFVALKILPKAFSSDSEYQQRFEREARVLAAINHPNILSIHDTATEGDTHYLVCELLEGMTLRQRLQEGPLPIRRCVEIAIQVANGLAAAHEKGVTHRDLKPENIFLLKDGRIKILDFGLAKQAAVGQDGDTLSLIEPQTQGGVVLGTVGYMSPEQVRGRPADVRSDIFSLGVVLYEMVTGQRAFSGDSSVEVMNAILKDEPPDLAQSGKNIPKGLSILINRCLEKNPDGRFQSARDLGFALEAAESGSSSVAQPVSPTSRSYARAIAYGVACALLLLATYFAGRHYRSSAAPPNFRRLTFRPGTVLAARFAPDGRTIVYGAKLDGQSSKLYVTSADSPESRALDRAEVSLFAVSDNGELAVVPGCRQEAQLVDCHGTLARMPLSGGAPRDVMNDVEAADWLPNTDELAVAHRVGGVNRVEFPIGNTVYETPGWISSIRVAPDGSMIGIAEHGVVGSDGGDVLIVDRNGRKKAQSRAFEAVEGLAWPPSAAQVWFVGSPWDVVGWANELHFLSDSGHEGLLWTFQGVTRLHDISREGRLLISREDWRIGLNFRGIGDREERDLSWFDGSELMDLAPDGSEVVFVEANEAPRVSDVYLRRTDGSPAVRLGEGDWGNRSPDGHWVVTTSFSPRGEPVLIPTGVGSLKPIPTPNFIKTYSEIGFLPDGRHIVFAASDGQRWRIYTQDLSGGMPVAASAEIGQPEAYSFQQASPDGKFAWGRDLQGRLAIYPLDGSAPRPVPGVSLGDIPANWGSDNNHVYVYQNDFPITVYSIDLTSGKRTAVMHFNPRDPIGLEGVRSVRVSPDGKFGAYSYFRALSQLYLVRDFNMKP